MLYIPLLHICKVFFISHYICSFYSFKGAIAVCFNVFGTSLLFINSHFACKYLIYIIRCVIKRYIFVSDSVTVTGIMKMYCGEG